jgi:hypothetical protein
VTLPSRHLHILTRLKLAMVLSLALAAVMTTAGLWLLPSLRPDHSTKLGLARPAILTTPAINPANPNLRKVVILIGQTKLPVSSDEIDKWLVKDAAGKPVSADINAVSAYMASLSRQYNKDPLNRLLINQPDGSTSSLTPGTTGQQLTDTDAAIKQISEGLMTSKTIEIKLNLTSLPFKTVYTDGGRPIDQANVCL